MSPQEIVKRLYLGDRYCIKFEVSNRNEIITITMDSICVLGSAESSWNPGSGKEVVKGEIQFLDVHYWSVTPAGLRLCDWVEFLAVSKVLDSYEYQISVGGIASTHSHPEECILVIRSKNLKVIDPADRNNPIFSSE